MATVRRAYSAVVCVATFSRQDRLDERAENAFISEMVVSRLEGWLQPESREELFKRLTSLVESAQGICRKYAEGVVPAEEQD